MTTEEAIRILNLEENYNLNILKKQYYKKAKQYHPDMVSNLTEEEKNRKMQEINNAYDFLKSQLKYNDTHTKTTTYNQTKTNYNNDFNYNNYYKRGNETDNQIYLKKVILDFIKTEIMDLKQIKSYCEIHNQSFILKICNIYLEQYQYITKEIDVFCDFCFFDFEKCFNYFYLMKRKIMTNAYLEYKGHINCFRSKGRAKKIYEELWDKKKELILQSKTVAYAINCFMEIVRSVENIEVAYRRSSKKKLYLDKISLKIQMIMDDYSNYVYYDAIKKQVLSIKNIAFERIADIVQSDLKDEIIENKVAKIIKNMQEEINVVFDDYASKIELDNKKHKIAQNFLIDLKYRFIKMQRRFKNKTIPKKIKYKKFK